MMRGQAEKMYRGLMNRGRKTPTPTVKAGIRSDYGEEMGEFYLVLPWLATASISFLSSSGSAGKKLLVGRSLASSS